MKNGFLSGKIGETVHYQARGRQLVRRRPVRKAPPTEGELLSRHMLELTTAWIKPVLEFVRIGFRKYHENYEGFNAAVSVVRKEALQKNGYNSSIDPSKARLSHGNLANAEDLQAELLPDGTLNFTWIPTADADASPRDRVMLLAYNVEKAFAVQETFGNKRLSGSDSLQLPLNIPGSYHLYAAFIAEDLGRQSQSKYLGSVQL